MTDAFEGPTDGGPDTGTAASASGSAAGAAGEAFTPADLVTAGDALAPDLALDPGTDRDPDDHATDAASSAGSPESAASEAAAAEIVATAVDPGDASLLGLIDRLGAILERSDLTEIEVEAGRTTVVLRKPAGLPQTLVPAVSSPVADAPPAAAGPTPEAARGTATTGGQPPGPLARPSVKAPLTGIWYASPTPGSAPFVEVGRELAVGQVVGLIEAMKLFNEIKSDLAGRVIRIVPDSGTLVKAKQPLIEVDPL